jgi:hypothetical protein
MLLFLFQLNVFCQEIKNVTLVSSGEAATLEGAKQIALKTAVEKTFGAFVSSKVEILNDNLIKDELVSISSGNVQNYELVSEFTLPNGNYSVTLKVTVSVKNLCSFVENKGYEAEFKGNVFASNIQLMEFYAKNEVAATKNLFVILKDIAPKSFDCSVNVEEPTNSNGKWQIPIKVAVSANSNFGIITTSLEDFFKNLAMTNTEVDNYKKLNKEVYPVSFATDNGAEIYFFRTPAVQNNVVWFCYYLANEQSKFEVTNGVEKFSLSKYIDNENNSHKENNLLGVNVLDKNFRVLLRPDYDKIAAPSLFVKSWGTDAFFEYWTHSLNFIKILEETNLNDFYISELYNKRVDDFFLIYDKSSRGRKLKIVEKFYSLRKVLNQNKSNCGVVFSFAGINPKEPLIIFEFEDSRSIEEITKISKYSVTKK